MRSSWHLSAIAGIGLTSLACAQTLFTTDDYRQDRELWTDPAYYLHNTARQLSDMQVSVRYGEEGSGEDRYVLQSPYDYANSREHYQALLDAADGGTRHTLESLPDWDGYWTGGPSWLDSRGVQASTVAAALTPQYRAYYVQQVKAESEGRHWWAASFCLPDAFTRSFVRGIQEFIIRPHQVWIINSDTNEIRVRWIPTDGRGHLPEDFRFPKLHGASIGFWDGDALIVHTNQIRRGNTTHSMFEFSDQMTVVERYERMGDSIIGEIAFYDPEAFVAPLHVERTYSLRSGHPELWPAVNTCTDTNGPSSNIHVREDGVVDYRNPVDSEYWDPTDPRPWATHYALGE